MADCDEINDSPWRLTYREQRVINDLFIWGQIAVVKFGQIDLFIPYSVGMRARMTEQMCSAQIATRCNEEKSNAPKAKRLRSERGRKGSVNALSARARFHFTNPARRFAISERIEHPKEARRRGERGEGEPEWPPAGPKTTPVDV